MMAKNADDRYATCSEVLEEIRSLHGDVKTPPVDESAGREPTMAIAPPPLPEPDLPEDLERLAAGSRRRPFRDWAATMFRRHAPEFVKELQTTSQQVDGAVAEYERRRNRLDELSAEAREVAEELARQLEENRRAGLQSAADAAAAESEDARQEALAEKERCDRNVASRGRRLGSGEDLGLCRRPARRRANLQP
jgi:hypothetical protein